MKKVYLEPVDRIVLNATNSLDPSQAEKIKRREVDQIFNKVRDPKGKNEMMRSIKKYSKIRNY
jgi:hypothetical protein